MENLLYEMYADMGTNQKMSLGQLQQANPDLFAQMRATAEIKVNEGSQGDSKGIVSKGCCICIFYYLYVDSLTYAFSWSVCV
jgi:hypothetical protein